jgi:hypothetical protein
MRINPCAALATKSRGNENQSNTGRDRMMKLTLRESACFSKHGVVAISMLAGIAACGDVEPSHETISVTRQGLTLQAFAVADATISNIGSNLGGDADCRARTESPPLAARWSCLMRWNLTSIPVGSTVTFAIVTVQVLDSSTNPFTVYKLLPSWSQRDVSWVNREANATWQLSGAMGSADRSIALTQWTLSNLGSMSQQLPAALVQSWVNNPASNWGISLAGTGIIDAVGIASREHQIKGYAPKLTVSYNPPSDSGVGGGGP